MADVVPGELVDGLLDGGEAAGLPHGLGGEVGVGARAVPVALHRLRVHGDDDAEVLGAPVEQEPAEPQLVAHRDPLAGSDLELPLGGHHLGIRPGDGHAGVEAGPIVSLDDIATVNLNQREKTVKSNPGRESFDVIVPCWRRRRNSRGPGVRGTRSWASRRGGHPGRGGCTPARCRTRETETWRAP